MGRKRDERIHFGIAVLLLVLVPRSGAAAGTTPALFEDDAPLEMVIRGEIRTILRDNKDERDYHSAVITYRDAEGSAVDVEVRIRTRGRFRRDPRNCNFAPLQLKFDRKKVKDTVFRGIKKVKLVTHCQSGKKIYQQYMLREYLVYRLYNVLTPVSFRVRLAHITYADVSRGDRELKKYGFFIEPTDMMASRNQAAPHDIVKEPRYTIDSRQSCFLSVFQFMIGNTDWSFIADHNVERIAPATGSTLGVPYDFDYAGIVDTHYALPIEQAKTLSTKDRYFQGFCQPDEVFVEVFEKFNAKKKELFSVIESFPLVDKRYKRKTAKFLEEFFEIINNPNQVQRRIRATCVEKDAL